MLLRVQRLCCAAAGGDDDQEIAKHRQGHCARNWDLIID